MAAIDDLPEAMTVTLFPGKQHAYVLHEQTAAGKAQTKFSWDPVAGTFGMTVTDPNHIIPEKRTYQLQIVGVKTTMKPFSGRFDQRLTRDLEAEDQQAIKLQHIFAILQHAKVAFDLKKQLWQSVNDMPASRAALTVASLAPATLSDALLEILLND